MPEEIDDTWDDILKILWHHRSTFRHLFLDEYDEHFNEIYTDYVMKQPNRPPEVEEKPETPKDLDLRAWNSLVFAQCNYEL